MSNTLLNKYFYQVDVYEYLPEKTRIDIDKKVIEEMFEFLYEKLGRQKLSQILSISPSEVSIIKKSRITPSFRVIKILLDLTHFSKDDLFPKIIRVKSNKKRVIPLHRFLMIDPIFAEWFGLYLSEGYNASDRSSIGLSNTNPEIIKFGLEILKIKVGLVPEIYKVYLRLPSNREKQKEKIRMK